MKSDSKPSTLIAAVPAWAQEPGPAPVRVLKTYPATVSPPNSCTPAHALHRIDEAAAILKVSSKTLRRLLTRGDLMVVRIGRLVRIHSLEIDRLIAYRGTRGGDVGGGGDHD